MNSADLKVRCRPPTEQDRVVLFALAKRFATSFAVEKKHFEASFRSLLRNASVCFIVAEAEGQIVGYLLGFQHDSFFANGPVSLIEELMVVEKFRRRGVGRHLVGYFEQWATKQGSRLVSLATRRAGDFYKALGYEESASYFRKVLVRQSADAQARG